ncbi:hypothetical protein [Bacillus aquiflavi]|uniref:hypothetical protein n=1 Tax=Bacillus aquiflavi TaxID=2672567 RepID=UPI001FE8EEDD|nr:hypothetical protein [Bacillus aquiflavi]
MTKIFPIHKYKSLEDKLSLFDWELHIDAEIYWESELKEEIELGYRTKADVEEIRNKAYKTEKVGLGDDVLYKVHTGDVWLGTLKKGNILQY